MLFRVVVAIELCFLALGVVSTSDASTDAPRPNILVIMVDDMGYSDLGCYGSEIKTPHLDQLASEGIRYTQMYNTAKCWTTRISLLTGLYHHRSGRDFERTALAGEVLRPAGYHTWWSGKHHADFNPHERGFDHFSGFLGGAINFWNPSGIARQGEPSPDTEGGVYAWAFDDQIIKPYQPEKGFYATDDFTDWSLEWLDEAKSPNGSIEDPFFLYVAYNAPHYPLHAHPKDIDKYKGVYDAGYDAVRKARYQRQLKMGLFDAKTAPLSKPEAPLDGWKELSQAEKRNQAMRMAVHAAMVDRVDQNVGRLLSKLKDLKELDNTLVLFLVDNGACPKGLDKQEPSQWGSVGTSNGIGKSWAIVADTPFRFWKLTSYEGGACTPMIAHWPQGITKQMRGQIYREPCHLIDLMPTWVELAKAETHYPGESEQANIPPIDGVSVVPSFRGEPLNRTHPIFFQYGSGSAVRDGSWKIVRGNRNADWELHNFESGRTEGSDLSGAYPERVKAMDQAWQSWYQDATRTDFGNPTKQKQQSQQNGRRKKATKT